jgi:GNS1/SUR4 family
MLQSLSVWTSIAWCAYPPTSAAPVTQNVEQLLARAAYYSVALNSLVHIIMYTYYFLSSTLPKETRERYLWWGRYLTMFQMFQFVTMLVQARRPFPRCCMLICCPESTPRPAGLSVCHKPLRRPILLHAVQ